jgi:ABC-type bacteriocin/lantibiotic exporter with double-glycine peptidase domain
MFTFGIYIIIAIFWKNETLLTTQAFTSIALISLLTTPVVVFIQSLPSVVQCIGNFDRIQEYCEYYKEESEASKLEEDIVEQGLLVTADDLRLQSLATRDDTTQQARAPIQSEVIKLDHCSYAWRKASHVPVLQDITAQFRRGTVTAIVGRVGSGKTSFLNALLGELSPIQDTLLQPHGLMMSKEPVAYCEQQPWLENGSIRRNIVGGTPWDSAWYITVLRACCLDNDIGQLEKADQTRVGSKGVALSGGQKQRIVSSRFTLPCSSKVVDSNRSLTITSRPWLELYTLGRGFFY